MAQFKIYAQPANFYAVKPMREGEDPIIMQSVLYGVAPLACEIITGNLQSAIAAAAQAMNAKLIATNPAQPFAISTLPIGRKPPGFDAARVALRPSYYGPVAPVPNY